MTADRNASPRLKMISIIVSDGCELARWALERAGLDYFEELHAPFLHVFATLPTGGGKEVPVLVTPTGVWSGLMGILEAVDARSPAGRNVFGETESERLANSALLQQLIDLIGQPLRRYVYHLVLPNKRIMAPLATFGAPAWERAFVYWLYPVWRMLLGAALGDKPQQLSAAPGLVDQGMALVEAELERRGTPFLGGNSPRGTDIAVSALLSPAVFPSQFGGRFPRLEDTPAALQAQVHAWRERRAGRLALATYELVRRQ